MAEKLLNISGKQRRQLRALGHHLHPVVLVGKEGVTEELLKQVDVELLAHELIKIKVHETAPIEVKEVSERVVMAASATLAQIMGRTALLYRAHPDTPVIQLVTPKAIKRTPARRPQK